MNYIILTNGNADNKLIGSIIKRKLEESDICYSYIYSSMDDQGSTVGIEFYLKENIFFQYDPHSVIIKLNKKDTIIVIPVWMFKDNYDRWDDTDKESFKFFNSISSSLSYHNSHIMNQSQVDSIIFYKDCVNCCLAKCYTEANTEAVHHDTEESNMNNQTKFYLPKIKKVIFNNPATIVFWADGTKTVVKVQGKDKYDREKGLSLCIAKKALGNNYNWYDRFDRWLKEE